MGGTPSAFAMATKWSMDGDRSRFRMSRTNVSDMPALRLRAFMVRPGVASIRSSMRLRHPVVMLDWNMPNFRDPGTEAINH